MPAGVPIAMLGHHNKHFYFQKEKNEFLSFDVQYVNIKEAPKTVVQPLCSDKLTGHDPTNYRPLLKGNMWRNVSMHGKLIEIIVVNK